MIVVTSLLMASVFFFFKMFYNDSLPATTPGQPVAGAKTCISCTRILSTPIHTAIITRHRPPSPAVILKTNSLIEGPGLFYGYELLLLKKEVVLFPNPLFVNDREMASEKFDIAFGSAEKAQTMVMERTINCTSCPELVYQHQQAGPKIAPGFRWGRRILKAGDWKPLF